MRFYLKDNPERQREFNARKGIQAGPLTDEEKNAIVDYLAKNFGPDKPPLFNPPPADPNRHLPRTLLQGKEAKYFAVELDLSPVQVGSFAVDSGGTVWINEKTYGNLWRLNPKTMIYTR